uniref:Uncharacterized protein n=1 Tax=Tetranychus urticae TaxID=32264 RepID=T1KEE6_TETUR
MLIQLFPLLDRNLQLGLTYPLEDRIDPVIGKFH